jgi:hypothetical protein
LLRGLRWCDLVCVCPHLKTRHCAICKLPSHHWLVVTLLAGGPAVALGSELFRCLHLATMIPVLLWTTSIAALQLGTLPKAHKTRMASELLFRRRPLLFGAATALFGMSTAADALTDRADAQFAYRVSYPDDWTDASKPVRTHLHELLLSSPQGSGVKLGITVDPVKIESLEAFGTLDEVTARVLAVEEGRDGVKSVTLRSNSAEAGNVDTGTPSYYTIEYATISTRGTKVFCCALEPLHRLRRAIRGLCGDRSSRLTCTTPCLRAPNLSCIQASTASPTASSMFCRRKRSSMLSIATRRCVESCGVSSVHSASPKPNGMEDTYTPEARRRRRCVLCGWWMWIGSIDGLGRRRERRRRARGGHAH